MFVVMIRCSRCLRGVAICCIFDSLCKHGLVLRVRVEVHHRFVIRLIAEQVAAQEYDNTQELYDIYARLQHSFALRK